MGSLFFYVIYYIRNFLGYGIGEAALDIISLPSANMVIVNDVLIIEPIQVAWQNFIRDEPSLNESELLESSALPEATLVTGDTNGFVGSLADVYTSS